MGVSSSPHIVLVSVLGLLDDELGVKQHKAAHNEQSQVHVSLWRTSEDSVQNKGRGPQGMGVTTKPSAIGCYLEEEEGPEEDVHEGHKEQEGQAGHQHS